MNPNVNPRYRLKVASLSSLVASLLSLNACSSLSGIGGGASLSCPLDAGGTCQSIRTTHEQVSSGRTLANAMRTPTTMSVANNSSDIESVGNEGINDTNQPIQNTLQVWNDATRSDAQRYLNRNTPNSGTAIRSEANVLRVWIAPYEDDEGVLRDQAYAYVALDNARWLIEHNQKRIMQSYAPVTGPSTGGAPTDSAQANQNNKNNSANQTNQTNQTNSAASLAEGREQAKNDAIQMANDTLNFVDKKAKSFFGSPQ
jgi:conjugal transfer pilus assembly protein TraV